MKCHVYRSSKRSSTYVYLRDRDGVDVMPASLKAGLGRLEFVFELDLTPERKLATQDPVQVMQNLRELGFHVQFPPNEQVIEQDWS